MSVIRNARGVSVSNMLDVMRMVTVNGGFRGVRILAMVWLRQIAGQSSFAGHFRGRLRIAAAFLRRE